MTWPHSATNLFTADETAQTSAPPSVPQAWFVWRAFDRPDFRTSSILRAALLLEYKLRASARPAFSAKAQEPSYELAPRAVCDVFWAWLFNAEIDNEIINTNILPFPFAPFTIPSYRNAANTRHTGLEVGANALLKQGLIDAGDHLSWRTAYTWSRFRLVDDVTFGDNFIPGAPRHLLRSELRYEHTRGFWVAPNVDWSPATYFVDSANTFRNDSYAVLNLKAGRTAALASTSGRDLSTASTLPPFRRSDLGVSLEPANGRSATGLRWRMEHK